MASTIPTRAASFIRDLEHRAANPLLRTLLRSRLHWLVSGRLTLVSYVGPTSGTRYTFPVAYHHRDGDIVVVTPRGATTWWRTFQPPYPCRVWLRGTNHPATGALVTGEERQPLLEGYRESQGLLGRLLGIDAESDHTDIAVVRFRLEDR